jgi:hypothetical protein
MQWTGSDPHLRTCIFFCLPTISDISSGASAPDHNQSQVVLEGLGFTKRATHNPVPSSKLLLKSWSSSAAKIDKLITSYYLTGEKSSTSTTLGSKLIPPPVFPKISADKGTWSVAEAGQNYRFEFHVPPNTTLIQTFDGKVWENYDFGPDPRSTSRVGNGNVLNDPKSFYGKDPRDTITSLQAVGSFTLQDNLLNPFDTVLPGSLADAYLSTISRASSPVCMDYKGKTCFGIQLARSPKLTAAGAPRFVFMRQLGSNYYPFAAIRENTFGAKIFSYHTTDLSEYRKFGDIYIPLRKSTTLTIVQPHGVLGELGTVTESMKLLSVNQPVDPNRFKIEFPPGARVFIQAKRQDWIVPAPPKWFQRYGVVASFVGLLVIVVIAFGLRSRRVKLSNRKNSDIR